MRSVPIAGQWSAFTAGVLEKALSYLIFILLVMPIAALIFVLCGLFALCRARPVVRLFSRGCQRLGVRLMRGGLQHLYLGLLQRVRFFFDFLFTCRVGLEYAAYVEATGTPRGSCCSTASTSAGTTTAARSSWIRSGGAGSRSAVDPGDAALLRPVHAHLRHGPKTAWRRCFDDEIAGRDALSTALINNAALFRSPAQPFVANGPSRIQPSPRACSIDHALRDRVTNGRRARGGRATRRRVRRLRRSTRHRRHALVVARCSPLRRSGRLPGRPRVRHRSPPSSDATGRAHRAGRESATRRATRPLRRGWFRASAR